MLDSILDSAKDYIGKAVDKNKDVPKAQNTAVKDAIFNTVSSSLTKQAGSKSGLDLSQLGSLLGGATKTDSSSKTTKTTKTSKTASTASTSNSLVDSMTKSVVDALTKKVGINSDVAQNLASSIIPGLISSVVAKKLSGGSGGSGGSSQLGKVAGSVLGGNNQLGNVAGNVLGNLLKKK